MEDREIFVNEKNSEFVVNYMSILNDEDIADIINVTPHAVTRLKYKLVKNIMNNINSIFPEWYYKKEKEEKDLFNWFNKNLYLFIRPDVEFKEIRSNKWYKRLAAYKKFGFTNKAVDDEHWRIRRDARKELTKKEIINENNHPEFI